MPETIDIANLFYNGPVSSASPQLPLDPVAASQPLPSVRSLSWLSGVLWDFYAFALPHVAQRHGCTGKGGPHRGDSLHLREVLLRYVRQECARTVFEHECTELFRAITWYRETNMHLQLVSALLFCPAYDAVDAHLFLLWRQEVTEAMPQLLGKAPIPSDILLDSPFFSKREAMEVLRRCLCRCVGVANSLGLTPQIIYNRVEHAIQTAWGMTAGVGAVGCLAESTPELRSKTRHRPNAFFFPFSDEVVRRWFMGETGCGVGFQRLSGASCDSVCHFTAAEILALLLVSTKTLRASAVKHVCYPPYLPNTGSPSCNTVDYQCNDDTNAGRQAWLLARDGILGDRSRSPGPTDLQACHEADAGNNSDTEKEPGTLTNTSPMRTKGDFSTTGATPKGHYQQRVPLKCTMVWDDTGSGSIGASYDKTVREDAIRTTAQPLMRVDGALCDGYVTYCDVSMRPNQDRSLVSGDTNSTHATVSNAGIWNSAGGIASYCVLGDTVFA